MSQKTVLLTGSSGFVGSFLQKFLADSGYLVKCTSSKFKPESTYQCDLRIAAAVTEMLDTVKPDFLIHLAALSSVTSGQTLDYYSGNVVVTENIINAIEKCNKSTRLIFFSTAGVYGNQPSEILVEDLVPLPVSHYAFSKYVCERMIISAFEGLNFTILRPFNIIGPGQSPLFIIPKLVSHFKSRDKIIEIGNVNAIRDFIDVNDCCSITNAVLENPASFGKIINLGTGVGRSVKSICELLSEITGHNPHYHVFDNLLRRNDVLSLVASTVELGRMFSGPRDFVPLKVSLEKMLGNQD